MSNIPPNTPGPTGDGYGYQAQPPMSDADQRQWSTLVHAGGILFGILPALVGYLMVRNRGAFIAANMVNALNFQISYVLYAIASTVVAMILAIPTFGLSVLLVLAVAVVAVVFMILAAVASNKGEVYQYPLTTTFVKS